MSTHLLFPLLQVLFSLSLIVVVLRGNFRNITNRLFSLFLVGLAVWGALIFGMRASPDLQHAYYWENCLIPVAPFIGVVLYHFAVRYTLTQIRRWFVPLLYFICFLFIFLIPTDLVHKGMQLKPYGYAPIFGPVFPVIAIFSITITLMGLQVLVKSYRTLSDAEHRNRIAYIILGVIFMFLGGMFDILPTFGVPLYPGMIIGNIAFCLLTTVAIMRHNLLDIRIVARKSLAYLLVSLVIAVPYVSILLLLNQILRTRMEPWWVHTIIVLLLAILLRPLYSRAQNLVDRLFYRDRYDYLKALETFSRQTQSLTDSAKLGSTMVNLIAKALRSSNVYLLQPSPRSSDFTTAFPTGENNPTPAIRLKKRGALVKWLERSNSMLLYEDIEIIPQLQGITSKEREPLEQVGAELISPLKAPTGQLSGILILGKKLSEQPYTGEDKQLIYAICNHMSTNLENVRLYNESQQEVEERKQAEEALQESKERIHTIVSNAPVIIWSLDKEGIFTLSEGAGLKALGLRPGEVVGQSAFDVYRDVPQICEDNRRALAGKTFISIVEVRNLVYESHYSPIRDKNGEVIGMVGVSTDITERKQAEEREKELQQELLRSSRLAAVGKLAAGVAHQINNPLTGVLGFSQRLLRKSTDEEVSQDLKRIYAEAERAAKVVQNLLTFARRREPKKEYSDINEILQSALELRAYELKTSNIEAVTDLAPSLPQVMIDFHQMQEAFLNIILNAEQAMIEANSGGKLTIKTEERKGYIRTTFTDDGPGITTEDLDKLFDPFFSTRGEKGGTGLGLSICHGIITEHGGRIYAKSKPGKGATFFVELPIISETANKHLIENE